MTMDMAMPLAMPLPAGRAGGEAVRITVARLLAVAGDDLKQPLQIALMAIECAVSDGVAPRAAARPGMASDALLRLGRELDDPEHCPTERMPVRRRKFGKIKHLKHRTRAARSGDALSRFRKSGCRFRDKNLRQNKNLSGRSVGLPTQVCLARTSQAGGAVPRPGPVPLSPLLATVAEEWRALADLRGITLRVCPTTACVSTDAAMLATILRNLSGNAVKDGRTGGRVVIGCRRRGRLLAIAVHDDGPGILPERLATIFEACDRAGRQDGAGLGLGLHIVRQTAQALRAPVSVASVAGRGTIFDVTLPRAKTRVADAYNA